jgi:PAS domain S-box-containing protein
VNHAFEQTTGYKAEEVLGRTPTMLSAGHNGLIAHRNIWDFVAENGDWHGEVWDRRKDGSLYPKQMRIKAIFDERGLASHFVAAFSDVSEAKAQAERLDYLARHDQLTNLPNRLALDKYLGNLLDSAVPGINRLALLIIDLDNFKTVNDSLGHHAAIACWLTLPVGWVPKWIIPSDCSAWEATNSSWWSSNWTITRLSMTWFSVLSGPLPRLARSTVICCIVLPRSVSASTLKMAGTPRP